MPQSSDIRHVSRNSRPRIKLLSTEKKKKKRGRRNYVRHPKFKVNWTEEEVSHQFIILIRYCAVQDRKLLELVNAFGSSSWQRIIKMLPGKSEIKCHTRWLELSNASINDSWTEEEDNLLRDLVR